MEGNDWRELNDLDKFVEHLHTRYPEEEVERSNHDLRKIIEELEKLAPHPICSTPSCLDVYQCFKNEDLKSIAGILIKFIEELLGERAQAKWERSEEWNWRKKYEAQKSIWEKLKYENMVLRSLEDGLPISWRDWRDRFDKIDAKYREELKKEQDQSLRDEATYWKNKFEKLEAEYGKAVDENKKLRLEKRKDKITEEMELEMKRLYVEEKWSLRKIGRKFNREKGTVKRILKKMGVEIRGK